MQFWRCIAGTGFRSLLLISLAAGSAAAVDPVVPTVFVKDSLAALNQPATIEARLVTKGLLRDSPLGGEPVELVVNGAVAATAMTGGDGRAVLSFVPKTRNLVPIHVRVGVSPRVSPSEGQAHLVVWERRTPILVVEVSSLMEESPAPGVIPGVQPEARPMSDAADELGKLTQFYYGVIYVVTVPAGSDGFVTSMEIRNWLSRHSFPRGLVLSLPSTDDALGQKIDELHAAGWKTIKIGVGRSKAFAEAFLRRRLEAIVVPEPSSKGDAPRKAKVAKDWKEVRKKL
jgi:hypothetical protein